ncbi:MAG TPA: MFS transporter [Burkholderiales bacterium]|nr:MFS transporter [Burkholderiales bacterium]
MRTLPTSQGADSPYAWTRLWVALALMTIGGAGMYSMAVVLPPLQAEFGIARGDASLPFTLTMIGFGFGGILMGKLSDRFGVIVPVMIGSVCLGLGFIAASFVQNLFQFTAIHGLLIGVGTSGTFVPLVADITLWFTRRRGVAVAIVMSGNYLAGTVWPPLMQQFIDTAGWRATYMGTGLICLLAMPLFALALRRKPPAISGLAPAGAGARGASSNLERPLGFSPNRLQGLLCVSGVACCVAMSMPQVHMVAYCADLGFPAARGAEMLALMMGFGIVSRLASGWIADRIGGLRTLLLGAALQATALALFLPFDGLVALYVVSALFGLFQGGIVPSYPLIVREHFSPREAGSRTGTVIMATLVGMALGGWMPGWIFDMTGSYRAAFVNGIAWSLVTAGIALFLLFRARPGWGLPTTPVVRSESRHPS